MVMGSPPPGADRFRLALEQGPLLLDAAMGTRLIARGLDLSHDDPALWNVDHPEVVAEIHQLDIAAGSDALTTNTFGANANWLKRFGRADEVDRINQVACMMARTAAGPDRFVIGCIGPTAIGVDGDDQALIHQALLLGDGGVDALILETNLASDHLDGVVSLLHSLDGLPIILSFALVVDDNPLPKIDSELANGLFAVGWNCIPPDRAVGLPDRLDRPIGYPLSLQPSGPWAGTGAPDEPSPGLIARLVRRGVRLFGGCCGTTEADIIALRNALGPSRIGVE